MHSSFLFYVPFVSLATSSYGKSAAVRIIWLEIYYFCTNYVIKIPNVNYIFSKQLHTSSSSIILSHIHAHHRACDALPAKNPSTLDCSNNNDNNNWKKSRERDTTATAATTACSTLNGIGTANYDSEVNVHVCDTDTHQHNAWAIALDMSAEKIAK